MDVQLLASVAQYLQQLAAAGDDQLTDGGTDRTYRNFHWMAVMLWRTFDDREALEAVRLAALGAVSPAAAAAAAAAAATAAAAAAAAALSIQEWQWHVPVAASTALAGQPEYWQGQHYWH
jgi:hypothetical protein